jgi:hypothetical protein
MFFCPKEIIHMKNVKYKLSDSAFCNEKEKF